MNLDHIFLEVGLSDENASLASVTSMAAVRTDRKGKVLAAYSEEVSIRGLEDAPLEKLYQNLAGSILGPYSSDYVVISQHSNIYKGLLQKNHFRGRPWLDIAQLAWPLGFCDMISNRDLDTLCKHFEVKAKSEEEGTISGNCEALVRVYWAMMKRYRAALIGEEAIRDFGGEALAGVRKFIGI